MTNKRLATGIANRVLDHSEEVGQSLMVANTNTTTELQQGGENRISRTCQLIDPKLIAGLSVYPW